MNKIAKVVLVAVGAGLAGWALENAWAKLHGDPPRYSRVPGVGGLPFLPVYAAGGAAVALAQPFLTRRPLPVKALAYGTGLTALELAAATAERSAGRASWAYEDGAPVSVGHSLTWAGMALLLDAGLSRA